MFKGMQNIFRKDEERKASQANKVKNLSPIQSANKLLADPHRQTLLAKFPQQMGMVREKYDNLCQALVKQFAEFVQLLPETKNSYYAKTGGFLNHALERTAIALPLCRNYFVHEGKQKALTPAQLLWMYTIFSAGILQGIGKIVTDFNIEIYNGDRHRIKKWMPLDGAMLGQGMFYDYEFAGTEPEYFRISATLLLARQLMPIEGFRWIASDREVLSVWLALLNEELAVAGTFGPFLIRADAEAIQINLGEFAFPELDKQERARNWESSWFSPTAADQPSEQDMSKPGEASIAGVEFLKWLHHSLQTGEVSLNQTALFSVPGGLLFTNELFKLFSEKHPGFRDWGAVRNSFLSLDLHTRGSENEAVQKFVRLTDQSVLEGVVLNKVQIVLPTINADALRQLLQLQSQFAHATPGPKILHPGSQNNPNLFR